MADVRVNTAGVELDGFLEVPGSTGGVVVFAHGSGSSRHSPRNQAVAGVLNQAAMATLLFDLLTPAEDELDEQTRELRFDIPLLAERVAGAVDWVTEQEDTAGLPIGVFGASTGAAAALVAAAERPDQVGAVVSRGGRPDLAADSLEQVRCPTLLIVGERDPLVLDLNHQARERMEAHTELRVIAGATHLFPEPGALEQVADLAAGWFSSHLG